ncbi:hypothetical protein P691DRAFT_593252 [Macrolepiota fuliginosa MF-IS2]|uniref:Uncharacterized protein n=1 Tax=Macrolepiota fuliginosa MF-IS2 TaxID=1400762 RepID=A0A9P5XCK5_9AGAR|nr:hypothetical protein P691DRAFT_593252 [Macrolepiota fuliginosa MF-IS2]
MEQWGEIYSGLNILTWNHLENHTEALPRGRGIHPYNPTLILYLSLGECLVVPLVPQMLYITMYLPMIKSPTRGQRSTVSSWQTTGPRLSSVGNSFWNPVAPRLPICL